MPGIFMEDRPNVDGLRMRLGVRTLRCQPESGLQISGALPLETL